MTGLRHLVRLNHAFGGKFPITWSLGIIGGVIALSVALALIFPKRALLKEKSKVADAPSGS